MLGKIIGFFDGWKTIIAYVLANIPFLTPYPLLKEAIMAVVNNPQDPAAIGNLVIQILFVIGIGHRIFKNVTGDSK